MNETTDKMTVIYGDSISAPKAFFILPHADAGDCVQSLHIGGSDARPTHHVSADAVLRALRDVDFWRQRAKEGDDQLMKEKAKIRRLMSALADEI